MRLLLTCSGDYMRVSIDGLVCDISLDEYIKSFVVTPVNENGLECFGPRPTLTFESFSISDYMSVQLCIAMLWERMADSYTCGPWTVERV